MKEVTYNYNDDDTISITLPDWTVSGQMTDMKSIIENTYNDHCILQIIQLYNEYLADPELWNTMSELEYIKSKLAG